MRVVATPIGADDAVGFLGDIATDLAQTNALLDLARV